jgi:hypothetical protein
MKNFNTAKLFFIGQVTISIGVELELKKSTNSNPTLTLVKKVSTPQLTPTSSWSCPSLVFVSVFFQSEPSTSVGRRLLC